MLSFNNQESLDAGKTKDYPTWKRHSADKKKSVLPIWKKKKATHHLEEIVAKGPFFLFRFLKTSDY